MRPFFLFHVSQTAHNEDERHNHDHDKNDRQERHEQRYERHDDRHDTFENRNENVPAPARCDRAYIFQRTRRKLGNRRRTATGDDGDAPSEKRVHITDERCREQNSGDGGNRGGKRLLQRIDDRNVISADFQ